MAHSWFDHTADLGVQITGSSTEAVFAEAAEVLGHALAQPQRPVCAKSHPVTITGLDRTDLLINWLRALLDHWTVFGHRVISADIVKLTDNSVHARIHLDTAPVPPHDMGHDIKAVTYHQARVARESDGSWTARVIFDV